MIMTMQNAVLLATTVVTGLIAGLFYSYSCSVIPGLGRMGDREYLLALQSINKAILNPFFFLSFMGTLILLPICSWMFYRQGVSPAFICLVTATLIYLSGVIATTAFGNIPLNNALENFPLDTATAQEIHAQRINFELPWNRLNHIRTFSSIATLALTVIACILTQGYKSRITTVELIP